MLVAAALAAPTWGWGHHAWWPWGGLMMAGWWVLVAALAVAAVRALRGPVRTPAGAEAILAERYARGEIDEAEYRRRLDVMREGR